MIRPIRLLKKSEEIYYLTMDKATYNLQDLLTQQMEKGELLAPKLVFDIFNQISEGLSVLHDADTVHGSLKPSNILIFGAGDEITIKLTDYEGFPGSSSDHLSGDL